MEIVRKDLSGNAVGENEIQRLVTKNEVCVEILSGVIKSVTDDENE